MRRSLRSTSVHCSNGRFVVTITLDRSQAVLITSNSSSAAGHGSPRLGQRYLCGLSVEGDLDLAEIDPRLARPVGQGDEDLGVAVSPGGDFLPDNGQSAQIAILIAEPLVGPLCGVALFLGRLGVVCEDLVDHGQEGIELGLWPRVSAAATKRRVGSSRVDLQACKLEYSIVSPK